MKIKDGFMLSGVAGSYVVVPVGAVQADFTGMITLNPVGAFLWGKLEKEKIGATICYFIFNRTGEGDVIVH